jgi:Fe-S-cluster containining protein
VATLTALEQPGWLRSADTGDGPAAAAGDYRRLHEIASEADARTDAWARREGLGCPRGCGTCCEGYVPDCLPVEAEYLALYLLAEKPQTASRMLELWAGPAPTGCPLYDPTPPFHCSVYPARPLVCRLFAFAGMGSKQQGGWTFRLCRYMPAPPSWRGERSISAVTRPDTAPPLMSQVEAEVTGLRPADAGLRMPLPEALGAALQRVLLRRSLTLSVPPPPQRAAS